MSESGNYVNLYYNVKWNASVYPSGIYFVKMISSEYMNTQKITLVK